MFLRNYEQQLAPQLSSELGEPILRCIALNAASMHDRMSMDSLNPLWRPSLIVNGQPHTPLPRTMFLILTPTRVLITDTTSGRKGYQPVLGKPILTLMRGDAEITAVHDYGLWMYHLKSRAESAELDLELLPGRGIAEELAAQLQEFSVTQGPVNATPGSGAPPESDVASQMVDARQRWRNKSYRSGGVAGVLLALVLLGFGGYQVYGSHFGTPTRATVVSCSGAKNRSCHGKWTLDGQTHTGRIWGDVNGVVEGSSLDIRVKNGWAFAPRVQKWPFIGGGIIALGAVYLFIPQRRRRRRADQ